MRTPVGRRSRLSRATSENRSPSSTKICVSIPVREIRDIKEGANQAFALGAQLVEFRLDYFRNGITKELKSRLSQFSKRCIMTVRSPSEGGKFSGSERNRLEFLLQLSDLRPAYVDIELETLRRFHEELAGAFPRSTYIVSWHNFSGTPTVSKLVELYDEARSYGGFSKIIGTAKEFEDNSRILSLYGKSREKGNLIAFCMGEKGVLSRVLCVRLGSPFTYAALPGNTVESGQLTIRTMVDLGGLIA
jgi:3-dehydroquinate dehydratase-1